MSQQDWHALAPVSRNCEYRERRWQLVSGAYVAGDGDDLAADNDKREYRYGSVESEAGELADRTGSSA